MFEKLAKFLLHHASHHVPGLRQAKPANDNRPHARDRGAATRPRLVCRWSLIEGADRLACHWEIEGSDEQDRRLGNDRPIGAAFHKTFFKFRASRANSFKQDRSFERCREARVPTCAAIIMVWRTNPSSGRLECGWVTDRGTATDEGVSCNNHSRQAA